MRIPCKSLHPVVNIIKRVGEKRTKQGSKLEDIADRGQKRSEQGSGAVLSLSELVRLLVG